MAGGLKFLNLKSWHPANAQNQKRIWIARQKHKAQEQREKEAAVEVRRNAEYQRYQDLAGAHGDIAQADRMEQQRVGFLYAPPPGLQKVNEQTTQHEAEGMHVLLQLL